MNGIGVVVSNGPSGADEEILASMLDALRTRGPDGRAEWAEPGVALGRTLAHIAAEDCEDEQPLVDPTGRWVLVADARIHNRAELASDLGTSRVLGDAETVMHAFLRWGHQAPNRLLGDFAFAIWDRRERQLFCARDPIGVRPLYYAHVSGPRARLLIASEIRPLFAEARLSREPNDASLALFLARLYGESGPTLFRDVRSLPAGCALVATAERSTVHRTYQPNLFVEVHRASDGEQAEAFLSVFETAVRACLRTEGPIGSELSGGVDSSAVACQATSARKSRNGGAPVELFSLRFPGLTCDEARYSDEVGTFLGVPIHAVLPEQRLQSFEAMLESHPVDVYYNPMMAAADVLLDHAVQSGCRQVLTGSGGDELFWWTGHEATQALREGRIREAWDVGIGTAWRSPHAWLAFAIGLVRPAVAPPLWNAQRRWRGGPKRWQKRLTKPAHQQVLDFWIDLCDTMERGGPDPIQTAVGRIHSHPEVQLSHARNDRVAARRRAEYANPLYDRRLTELALSIPHDQRIRAGLPKFVMRRALAGKVPSAVLERRDKTGFRVFTKRVLDAHAPMLRPLFAQSRLEERGILRPGAALQLLDDGDDVSMAVNVAAMELWLRDVRR